MTSLSVPQPICLIHLSTVFPLGAGISATSLPSAEYLLSPSVWNGSISICSIPPNLSAISLIPLKCSARSLKPGIMGQRRIILLPASLKAFKLSRIILLSTPVYSLCSSWSVSLQSNRNKSTYFAISSILDFYA